MSFLYENGICIFDGGADFIPSRIFDCGQCFRWSEDVGGSWVGVAKGRVARVRAEGGKVYITSSKEDFDGVWADYFDLGRDYAAIRRSLSIDDWMTAACEYGRGIRILRQDGWEALCSFIISQCNNIPRIKGIIERLCALCGEPLVFEGREYRAFPSAERVASLTEAELAPLRCGYRAAYILSAARRVASGALDLDAMAKGGDAQAALKACEGVGDKVASCVLLFGLGRLDAFPVDVWIRRTLSARYGDGFDPSVFGENAGIAQQYMYYYSRYGGK